MSNATKLPGQGLCPAPFLQEDLFPVTGGFVDGRFCASIAGPSCCLPCPQTEWLYQDNFNTITHSASWINVGGMFCSIFLLLSFTFLPVGRTHRHYLSVCLAVAIVIMQLGFIIPLAAKPEACFNAITPNDMDSNLTCAFSGAMLLAGGWCAVMWIFLRALALHLQICWQVIIGQSFMWGALATGWGIPAIGLTLALVLSGVSFRFGDTCHINHKNSMATFWIPLLVFAAVTVIVQFGTFGYCIKVYLASLRDDSTTTNSSGVRSFNDSLRATISPRQALRRIRKVLELQWRGIAIVLVIIADVVFFAIVFLFMDDLEASTLKNPVRGADWLVCLATTGGNKNACLKFAKKLVLSEPTVMAVLVLLSLNGFWSLLFLGRYGMFIGWYEMAMGRVKPNHEFVSADVRVFKDPSSYEMLSRDREPVKTDQPLVSYSVTVTPITPAAAKSGRETPDYFGREARYKPDTRSFSNPKPPTHTVGWETSPPANPRPYIYPGMDPLSMNKI